MVWNEQLEQALVAQCTRVGCTLAAAESCTGGLIAHRITNVPGASSVFLGGVTAYANAVKRDVLGVPEPLLAAHGAVSEPVVAAMIEGVLRLFAADAAMAVTGIAGPGGGTADKPVGTVYIAASVRGIRRVRRESFIGDRMDIKIQSADRALTLLLELLETS